MSSSSKGKPKVVVVGGGRSRGAELPVAEREESTPATDSKEMMMTSGVGIELTCVSSEWMRTELHFMMYGLGDSRRPSPASIILVETIVKQQMTLLMEMSNDVWRLNGAKGPITPQHILFLLTANKKKLKRVVRQLCLRDFRKKLLSESGGSVDDEEEEEDETLAEEDATTAEESGADRNRSRKISRRKICENFLAQIDQTGELLFVLDEKEDVEEQAEEAMKMEAAAEEEEEEDVKRQRHLRLERQTRFMEAECYLQFSKARTASFCRKNRLNKFREWVSSLEPVSNVSPIALEIIADLAFETVAQLVDLSLLVRGETSNCEVYLSDEQQQHGDLKGRKRKKSEDAASELCSNLAIQPNELLEAMRRLNTANGAMSAFAKSYKMPTSRRLLCL